MSIFQKTKKFIRTEEGTTAVEYAIMLAVIVLAVMQAIITLGTTSRSVFEDVANVLP